MPKAIDALRRPHDRQGGDSRWRFDRSEKRANEANRKTNASGDQARSSALGSLGRRLRTKPISGGENHGRSWSNRRRREPWKARTARKGRRPRNGEATDDGGNHERLETHEGEGSSRPSTVTCRGRRVRIETASRFKVVLCLLRFPCLRCVPWFSLRGSPPGLPDSCRSCHSWFQLPSWPRYWGPGLESDPGGGSHAILESISSRRPGSLAEPGSLHPGGKSGRLAGA